MSIFIDKKQTFEVAVKIKLTSDEMGNATGLKILPDDCDDADASHIICRAEGRDFERMSRIMEQSTVINGVTGEPMVHHSVLARLVLQVFFTEWNLVDEETQEPIPIDTKTINTMHYSLVSALARKWLKQTSGG